MTRNRGGGDEKHVLTKRRFEQLTETVIIEKTKRKIKIIKKRFLALQQKDIERTFSSDERSLKSEIGNVVSKMTSVFVSSSSNNFGPGGRMHIFFKKNL